MPDALLPLAADAVAPEKPAQCIHWCRHCGGEGRIYTSRYGGNDPDVWDTGECEDCGGSGNAWCEECVKDYATDTWREHGREYLLCRVCHDQWTEDAAA